MSTKAHLNQVNNGVVERALLIGEQQFNDSEWQDKSITGGASKQIIFRFIEDCNSFDAPYLPKLMTQTTTSKQAKVQ